MSVSSEIIPRRDIPPRSGRFLSFQNPFFSYGFAVFTVALSVVLTKLISPILEDYSSSFEFFLGAVLLSTYYGGHVGLGPALLASGLSILALDYFFIPPINAFAFGMTDLFRVTVFGAVAIMIGSLSGRLKKAKTDLQHAHDVLERRVHERTEELLRTNIQLKEEVNQRVEAQRAILEISHREQQRLGQDLHDGLIQVLTGARLIVEQLKGKLAAEKHFLLKDMAIIESCLSEALGQADTISRGLYPIELEMHGLMSALEELARKISNVHAVACRFVCRSPVLIDDPATGTHLFRIAQEAVANAIKGGKAKRINIRLSERNGQFLLSIADNGIGFKKGQVRNGMGLRIMKYRSRFINGDLRFLSRPGGGTVVRCVFHSENKTGEDQ